MVVRFLAATALRNPFILTLIAIAVCAIWAMSTRAGGGYLPDNGRPRG